MMNEAARRAPVLHRRVHGAAAVVAGIVAVGGAATGAGAWPVTVAAVAAVLLAAEAVTCRCLLEDAVRPLASRVAGWRR